MLGYRFSSTRLQWANEVAFHLAPRLMFRGVGLRQTCFTTKGEMRTKDEEWSSRRSDRLRAHLSRPSSWTSGTGVEGHPENIFAATRAGHSPIIRTSIPPLNTLLQNRACPPGTYYLYIYYLYSTIFFCNPSENLIRSAALPIGVAGDRPQGGLDT